MSSILQPKTTFFFFLTRSLSNNIKTKTSIQISGFITDSPDQETCFVAASDFLLCSCIWLSQRSIQSHSTARPHVFWTLGIVLLQSLPGKPHSAKPVSKCGLTASVSVVKTIVYAQINGMAWFCCSIWTVVPLAGITITISSKCNF